MLGQELQNLRQGFQELRDDLRVLRQAGHQDPRILRKNFKNFKETNMEDLCFKTSLQAASV